MTRSVHTALVGIALVGLGMLTGCTAPPSASQSNPSTAGLSADPHLSTGVRLLAEARRFAFRVRNAACDATGSSFATATGIVTNRHVASGSTTLELSSWNGHDFTAAVHSISESPGPDLALLANSSGSSLAPLATSDVKAGTHVWATGYPDGNQLSALGGIVVDYVSGAPYGEPGQVMQLTNSIKPGNSGSPLLDAAGKVVGVAYALALATGDGLAIPISTLRQYLVAPGANTAGACIA